MDILKIPNTINVLVFEDNPSDAHILRELLSRVTLILFRLEFVERLDQGLDKLRSDHFDIVLLDLGLPDCQGVETFERVHALAPDVPVIILTELQDEHTAVEAEQIGAQDYLIKGQQVWDVLPRSIRYALGRQQARAELLVSERRFRALIENSSDAIALMNADGVITYESPATQRIFGYAFDENQGSQVFTHTHPDDLAENLAYFHRIIDTPRLPQRKQVRYIHNDGTWHWAEITATNMLGEPDIRAIVLNFREISERKQAQLALQQSEARFRSYIEHSPMAIFITDPAGRFTEVNPAAEELLGYDTHSLALMRMDDLILDEDRQAFDRDFSLASSQGDFTGEIRFKRRDGENVWVSVQAVRLSSGQIMAFCLDITTRIKTEQDLRASEARLSNALATARLGHWEFDPATDLFVFNDRAYKSFQSGTKREGVFSISATRYLQRFVHPDDAAIVLREIRQAPETSDTHISREFEHRIIHADGETGYVSVHYLKLVDNLGNLIKMIGTIQDVTERKRTEAMLRVRLQLAELSHATDADGIITTALGEAEALTGSRIGFFQLINAEKNEIVLHVWSTKTLQSFNGAAHHPHGIDEIEGLSECLATGTPVIHNGHFGMQTLAGSPEHHPPITRYLIVPVIQNDTTIALMGVGNKAVDYTKEDVTILQEIITIVANNVARKQAEESLRRSETYLRQSEERLTLALTATGMGVWELNWETDTFYWSPECINILGETEFDGTLETFISHVHPEDIDRVTTSVSDAFQKKLPIEIEFRIIRPTGEIRWVSGYGKGRGDGTAQPVYMIGTIHDITERKRTQIERSVLMEIMQGSFAAEDLTTFLKLVHQAVEKAIKAENLFVILYNKQSGLFEEVYVVDEFDPPAPPSRLEQSISAYVFRTGQPMLMSAPEFARLEAAGELELVGTDSSSWLGVPLKIFDETIGVLAVQDYHDPDCYSDRDRDLLASVAGQIALAVERKRAEIGFLHLSRQMELILNSAGEGVYGANAEGIVTFINPAMARMIGYSPSELIGQDMHDTCHYAQADGQPYSKDTCSVLEPLYKGLPIQGDDDILWRKDGTCFPVEFTSTPIYEDNQITGIVVVVKDITERKHAEEEARRRAARAEALDHFSQLLATPGTSEVTIIETLTRELVNLLGDDCAIRLASGETGEIIMPAVFYQDDQIPAALRDLLSIAPKHTNEGLIGEVFRTGEPVILSAMSLKQIKDIAMPGFMEWMSLHHISDLALLPLNAQGKIIGTVSVAHHTSERMYTQEDIEFLQGLSDRAALAIVNARLLEQVQDHNAELEQRVDARTSDLSRANAELESAARAKDEFLASMSHELRTPLNAILTLTESLEEGVYGELRDSQAKPLRIVSESGHHLLNLINDILDLSKIEAGKLVLQIGTVEIETICQASLRLIKQQAQKKRLHMTLHLDENALFMQADARCLKQMLVNLLSNAVKFTPEGGQIGLDVSGDAEHGIVSFTVWDNGIGIDPQDAQRLFKPFVQADSSLSRQYGGTGLGLSLVYRMAEMHRGSISMSSVRDQGSRFTIMLPWEQNNGAGELAEPDLYHLTNIHKALIIEDSPTAADQMERYLNEVGVQVFVQPAGETALQKIAIIQPDIILLDILLPGITGWEVLDQIKKDPQMSSIPVIMVSVVNEPERGLAMGAIDYLVKPVSRTQLYKALQKTIPDFNETTDTIKAWISSHRPVVLIAEDNLANQTTFSDYLKDKGCQVILATNGMEAIERAHEVRPDLILMDIQMPGLDGLETIRRLRSDVGLHATPIIAITALAMPGDRERCLASGADEYIAKPLSLKKLVYTVSEYLSRKAL